MQLLLTSMGNPQNAAKTIHITGSKGKGSTATFITHILHEAGFKTALFTSPHLHSYTERLVFDLSPISEIAFAAGISNLQPYIENLDKQGHSVSTFGMLTALFFQLVSSAKTPIDWQIVEVGLGGKDDVTNVFTEKEAAVITPISLEHTAILGATRQAIAENKAGIITAGCLTILAPQNDSSVEKIISEICTEKKAHLIKVPYSSINSNMPLEPSLSPLPDLKMIGEHQSANALTARTLVHALSKQGHDISENAIKIGLSSAFLPGRFEIFQVDSGGHVLPRSKSASSEIKQNAATTIVLDGAHNGDSAGALAETLESHFPNKQVIFIIGVNQDKNLEDIWLALKEVAASVIAAKSDNYRSMLPEQIKERLLVCQPSAKIYCANTIEEAFSRAREINKDQNIICVCGSLYLVAEAREKILGEAILTAG